MNQAELESKNLEQESETSPKRGKNVKAVNYEDLDKRLVKILSAVRNFDGNKYKNPIEEIPVELDYETVYELKWTGPKDEIGFVGHPYYGVVKRYDEREQRNVIVGYTCNADLGVPVTVLQYVPELDCIAVIRSDVYPER